jgi:hypothetical protein
MKKVTESWSLGCSAERFWQVFFDADTSRSLYLDGLGFKQYRVLSDDPAARRLYLSPKLNLPGPVAKLIGDSFAYEQHGAFDRAIGRFTWKMVQPGDKAGKPGMVSSSGWIQVVDAGPGKCTRTDEVTVQAHVFGLGGMIESSVETELRSSWAKELAFLRPRLAP